MNFKCAHCGVAAERNASHVNRSRKIGAALYCGRTCMGLARRLKSPPTDAERRAAKRAYDMVYRAKNTADIKAKKHAHFRATYDPAAAAIERKKKMPRHVAYCQRPEYVAWKKDYDLKYRANKDFGPFAEAFLTLREIETEVDSRATRQEIYQANQTFNKAQTRRRAL